MVPTVYFFYPETAYRSLEEMDEIFQEAQGLKGIFTVVKIAKHKPHRYGKNGELLIQYDETEAGRRMSARRNSSVGAPAGDVEKARGRDEDAAEFKDVVEK